MAVFLISCHSMYAQSYDKNVEQYCYHVNNHPLSCGIYHEFSRAIYGGIMMSSTSGTVAEKHNLGGLDIGMKLTNAWGYSCQNILLELNGYVDLKFATKLGGNDDSDGTFTLGDTPTEKVNYTDFAAQITITPGIRINKWSIDCGPYIAYSGYKNDTEELFTDPDVSGMEFGIRVGTAIHFSKVQLGLYYDKALSDCDKKFKKNDLMLFIGCQF